MNAKRAGRLVVAAAAAVVAFGASQRADAQFPAAQEGRALDANPRIGSGGFNQTGTPFTRNNLVTGNRIVTGNVTGGKEFRGAVPYTDPLEFRGALPSGNIDNFIRSSSAAPAPYQPGVVIPGQAQAFYGSRLAERPPEGFVERGFTGTYTPARPSQLAREQILGTTGPLGTSPFLYAPGGGETLLEGGLDPATQQPALITASPLLGVRQWSAGRLPDWSLLGGYGQSTSGTFGELRSGTTVQSLREELMKSMESGGAQQPTGTQDPTQPGANPNLARPVPTPLETPENTNLTGQPLSAAVSNPALTGQIRPGQAIADRIVGAPSQQSAQYAELQKRLDRYYTARLETDADRHRELLQQLRAKQAAERQTATDSSVEPGTIRQPGITPGVTMPDYGQIAQELIRTPTGVGPIGVTPPATQPGIKPQPLQIASLATGVRARGLANLLRGAEDLMKQGKYLSALEQYALAERVVPNNPLVWLGRAHAELGGGYFRRAEQSLRQAMTDDPTLLMGQYDLKGMIGQERLETLVKDLKDTAKQQENDPGPVLLLAYLAYNTGNPASAAMFLDEAERRADKKDPFYRLLRLHWALPGGQPAPDAAGPASTLPLSDVLKQFEEGNVRSAVLQQGRLSGEFRQPVIPPGGATAVRSFSVALPSGAASGPLAKWIEQHRQGADVRIIEPTTQPSK